MDEADRSETPERPDLGEFLSQRTAGEMLAAERRRQGKAVTDIAELTRIRGRLLEALENGHHEQLPSSAYVKGYIQAYAQALGMSAEPLLEAYRRETEHGDYLQSKTSAALGDPIVPSRENAHQIPPRLFVGVLIALALVGLIWVTLRLVSGPEETPAPLPPPAESTQTAESVPETSTGPAASTDPTAQAPAASVPGEPFDLVIAVQDADASWLRVIVDGTKVYEGTLDGGETRSWEVFTKASVRIGRPSVVSITRDGEPVTIPSGTELPTVEIEAE